ncbi:hypothetical protein RI129_008282 [Pyrocoelia pectoralis]|uniref:non-specific serine/threonine protein kinase n=1 Tax=Pyrocoelia pectoralis TaxID=417401 RepID=A0AAN7V528_9COLE
MKDFELIKQGAEARIYKGVYLGKPTLVKQRFEKKYRHPHLDNNLTKERIKAESRAIVRCRSAGIETPSLYLIDLKTRSLYLEYFEHSITAKDFIKEASDELIEKVAYDIGAALAKIHGNNIIHGDLTTSNILLVDKTGRNNFKSYSDVKLVLIDFGLAHMDSSPEDKGVDLYVLERAIISIHNNPDRMFALILKAYRSEYPNGHAEVLNKLDEVRTRGRKRLVIG